MKTTVREIVRLPFLIPLLLFLISGCASQSGSACGSSSPQLYENTQPNAPPIETAADDGLSEDEKLLLQDDLEASDEPDDAAYADEASVSDPLEPYNRMIFQFNDKLYFWILKPVASGYRELVPSTGRLGIKNFFTNIAMPIRLVNSILQGKFQAAESEVARFLYNTTVGVLGFGNPAKQYPDLSPNEEDLGQTLAGYGAGNGLYIVWPLLGPSTLRDSIGMFGDFFLDPVFFVEPLEVSLALTGFNTVNSLSFRIGDYETLKKAALDPYQASRNGYIQLRQSQIAK